MADNNRYFATMNGRTIDATTVSDGFKKALVTHEYPMRNGGTTEDLGLFAREIRIASYWINENYEEHKGFLRELAKTDLSEFVHPEYGPIIGRVKSADVTHDDGLNSCQIEISFVEDTDSLSILTLAPNAVETVDAAFVEGQQEQLAVAQVSILSLAHALLAKIETGIAYFDGLMINAVIPANALIATISYGNTLPDRLVGAVANCAARYAVAYQAALSSPVAFVSSLNNAFKTLKSQVLAFTGSDTVNVILARQFGLAAAQQLSLQVAAIFDAEESARSTLRTQEGQTSFDAVGNFVKQPYTDDILNVRDLEKLLYIVRGFCAEQIGIYGIPSTTATREVPAIKKMCASLLSYVSAVKLEMDKIIEVDIDPPMPLHMVCLRHGLPYNAADRILSINNIVHPSYVSGRINIYASAVNNA